MATTYRVERIEVRLDDGEPAETTVTFTATFDGGQACTFGASVPWAVAKPLNRVNLLREAWRREGKALVLAYEARLAQRTGEAPPATLVTEIDQAFTPPVDP